MSSFTRRPLLLALAASAVLAACGGGGGGGSTTSGGTSGSTGSAKPSQYTGPITGFGSVILNGVRFSSVGATVTDDDGTALRSENLRLGQTVRVDGSSDDTTGLGDATAVTLIRGTQGAITSVNSAAGSFVLMGQTVNTNAGTAYQGVAGFAGLVAGSTVEVYGIRQADGSILATLVEQKALTGSAVRGALANLNTTAKTFQVGTLTVNYASATVVGNLANGRVVKVKSASLPAGNVLTAGSVKVSDDASTFAAANGGTIKIKGVADAAPASGKLIVSGTPVDVSKAVIKGGSTIAAGQVLEVKGTWDGTTLQATEVEFEGSRSATQGGSNELYGSVSAFTSVSSFVVNGVTVDASAATFSGGSATQLAVGVYLEVKGNVQGNVLKATKVEFKSASTPTGGYFEQNGTVSNFVSVADFRVGSLRVDASTAQFEHGSATSLRNGAYVEIKGSVNASGVFKAVKVEFKS